MTDIKNGDIELEDKAGAASIDIKETDQTVAGEKDENIQAQLIKEGEPMMITNMFVDKPITVLFVGILVLFMITFISAGLGYFDIAVQHNREFLVWSDEKVRDWDMLEAAKEAI